MRAYQTIPYHTILLATSGPHEQKLLFQKWGSHRGTMPFYKNIKQQTLSTVLQNKNLGKGGTAIIGQKHAGRDLGAKWCSHRGVVLVFQQHRIQKRSPRRTQSRSVARNWTCLEDAWKLNLAPDGTGCAL